ncbi:hypothetical protein AVT69_gp037 [Pseudomonas phage PhiPA3]|uniref:Uncharacterized protein 036 n=1 Tax=Pseudomonas phage PhiPA3 TaxID=998086 RepID=F8SJR8_BPPA3|nr:hypothetical protein AVT69_gp037 [Pseudomonas phage PhiPA3]AEH03463.1 hypothetical protein [Pseudomonas phage PhiPA3]
MFWLLFTAITVVGGMLAVPIHYHYLYNTFDGIKTARKILMKHYVTLMHNRYNQHVLYLIKSEYGIKAILANHNRNTEKSELFKLCREMEKTITEWTGGIKGLDFLEFATLRDNFPAEMYDEWIHQWTAVLVQLHGEFNNNFADLKLSYAMVTPQNELVIAEYPAIKEEMIMTLVRTSPDKLDKIRRWANAS